MNEHEPINAYINEVETLMDIAVGLADFTQFPERCEEIPAYLSGAFQIQPLTLVIFRQLHAYSDPRILHASSSQLLVEDAAALHNGLLHLYAQTQLPVENPSDRQNIPAASGGCSVHEAALPQIRAYPRVTVLASAIDAAHRMLLVVHHRPTDQPLSPLLRDRLLIVTQELSKQLRPMMAWQSSPENLAKPFNLLSEREWLVLRGLNSDVCEKQLATRLGMCQHTLHSHIKSIYRKIGVQGRLQLLFRFNSLLRDMRMQSAHVQWPAVKCQRELACSPA